MLDGIIFQQTYLIPMDNEVLIQIPVEFGIQNPSNFLILLNI